MFNKNRRTNDMSGYNTITPEIIDQIKGVVAPNRVYTGEDINEDFSHDEMSIYGKRMPDAGQRRLWSEPIQLRLGVYGPGAGAAFCLPQL